MVHDRIISTVVARFTGEGKFFELFYSNKQSKSLKGRTKEISDSVNLTMEIVWTGLVVKRIQKSLSLQFS
jgi:hypothetical protein